MLRELRLPSFTVLYSRVTVILRQITNYWNEVPRALGSRPARLRVTASTTVGNLRGFWKSVQKDHRLATFRARILGRVTIAAQRIELIRQRTALLIGRWSRWTATTAQFRAERISAKLTILTHSQPLRRLRYACGKNLRVLTARAPSVWVVVEKKFAAWNLRRESMKAGSRLWIFIRTAALSALRALRVISSVRRYAPTPDTPKHNDRQPPSAVPPVIPATQGLSRPPRNTVAHRGSRPVVPTRRATGRSRLDQE